MPTSSWLLGVVAVALRLLMATPVVVVEQVVIENLHLRL
jgi:hypothetical protein